MINVRFIVTFEKTKNKSHHIIIVRLNNPLNPGGDLSDPEERVRWSENSKKTQAQYYNWLDQDFFMQGCCW